MEFYEFILLVVKFSSFAIYHFTQVGAKKGDPIFACESPSGAAMGAATAIERVVFASQQFF